MELEEANNLLDHFFLNGGMDHWVSKISGDDEFYVKDLRALIDNKLTTPVDNPTLWIKIVPLKVIGFVWCTFMDRIPTTVALSCRGIQPASISCPFCDYGRDDTYHILLGCDVVLEAQVWLYKWCNIPFQSSVSIGEFVNFAGTWGHYPKKREIVLSIWHGFLWCCCKTRSDMVFNKIHTSSSKLVDNVITLVYSWVSVGGNFGNYNWANWCCCLLNIL
ncbi:uncharacterized protein LOC111910077 [Lactuca sativa]|uniref:uncharacterized protein LOC111910077 n=1 Tax=Lactuca sativa TaxID=4236 RepID=UPI000CD9363C|nr:uncharacterized protein LOC111910077 [Lactuca sativa]